MLDASQIGAQVGFVVGAPTGLEQPLAAAASGPLHDRGEIVARKALDAAGHRILAGGEDVRQPLELLVEVEGDLVVRRRLPRQPQRSVPSMGLLVAGAAVRIERIRDDFLDVDVAIRR